ncbi:hypothetical protein [Cryobacterium sp. N22]|uniref:hypothetical protein n=1 Tax=Cryobacterium sp. N22 TaxID=2048290 RepID=UPI000CE41A3C|nr:hypothetical protein [Cryobacterium sp. N22]
MSLIVVPESASTLRSVRKRERRALVGLILVLAPLLTACTVTEPTPPEPTGLVTYPLPEDWVGMAGLKVGTLAFVDNCVRFDDGDIPAFPDKLTTWDGTTLTFAGEEYRMGDEISLGGGSPVEGATVSIPIPKTCGNGIIIIVSPPSRAER